jgi:heme-degrading monooxygenase HmoA
VDYTDYTIIWRYRVDRERRREFEAAYGPNGAWAALFKRADGFLGVDLLRSVEDDGHYVTIDRWTSQRAFDSFNADFATEYRSLDGRLEGIAATEERIGAFTAN